MLKSCTSFAIMVLMLLAPSVFALNQSGYQRGINFDPSSSLLFKYGVGICQSNPELGKKSILQAIKNRISLVNILRKQKSSSYLSKNFSDINLIKSFFPSFSDDKGQCKVYMADAVNQWNNENPDSPPIKVALGLYEFRPGTDACADEKTCEQWTEAGLADVTQSIKRWPSAIDSIIVGNEDLGDYTQNMESRIVSDVKKIKSALPAKNTLIKVGTAQTSWAVPGILQNQAAHQALLSAIDFLGVNIYPFWSSSPAGDKSKSFMKAVWDKINLAKGSVDVIETEEGWPSACRPESHCTDSRANASAAQDYFNYWYYQHRLNTQSVPLTYPRTSYYFQLADKDPDQGNVEGNWGIFSLDSGDYNESSKSVYVSSIFTKDGKPNKKVLAPGHTYLKVRNGLRDLPIKLLACDDQFTTTSKPTCWNINGYSGSSTIRAYAVLPLVFDKTLQYYKSILVARQDPAQTQWPGMCYINNLDGIKDNATVTINWQSSFGECDAN